MSEPFTVSSAERIATRALAAAQTHLQEADCSAMIGDSEGRATYLAKAAHEAAAAVLALDLRTSMGPPPRLSELVASAVKVSEERNRILRGRRTVSRG